MSVDSSFFFILLIELVLSVARKRRIVVANWSERLMDIRTNSLYFRFAQVNFTETGMIERAAGQDAIPSTAFARPGAGVLVDTARPWIWDLDAVTNRNQTPHAGCPA
jgi:hypothetical protein